MRTEDIKHSFLEALLGEDEVGCVVRSHLYVEAQVDRYLDLAVISPKHLANLDLSYAKKIDFLCCLGFDEEFKGSLKRLGKIRNSFAHNLSSQLTQEIVSDFYNTLPKFGRDSVHISVDLLNQALGKNGKALKYNELLPKFQFVLIVLNLERIFCAGCNLVEMAKNGNS